MTRKASEHTYHRPIIGVFVSNHHIKKLRKESNLFKRSFRYIRFIELVKANQEAQTTLYFFGSRDIKLRKRKISGTYYNNYRGTWEKKRFLLPDILYDRGGGESGKGRTIRQWLEAQGIPKINSKCILNKWDVYQRLWKLEKVRPYLPLTKLYKLSVDILGMFNESNALYLKACHSNSGKGVLKIRQLPDNGYEYCYSRKGRLCSRKVQNFGYLLSLINQFFKGRKFVIQQAIPLLAIGNQRIDFRAEVQRNGGGRLEIANIAVRIARKNSPITNVQSKPQVYLFDDFISSNREQLPIEVNELSRRIKKFLFEIYLGMENAYGSFGELGIDFGVDKDGAIQLIECNGRSAKVAAYLTKNQRMIRRVFLNPLEYAKFLYERN